MPSKRTHLALSWLALAAYVLNAAAVAGGAVLCQSPHGETSFELGCDHGHCAPALENARGHEGGDRPCAWCPCDHTPLGRDVRAIARHDDRGPIACGAAPPAPHAVASTPAPWRTSGPCGGRDVDRTLLRLRTVVLRI